MKARYCPKCGYTMIIDIHKKILWCPVCNTTEKIEKETESGLKPI